MFTVYFCLELFIRSSTAHNMFNCYLQREKTSQGFRDALHEHYKSSNAKKRTKRKILKSQKAISEPNKSLAIVSPSQSEKSLNINIESAFMKKKEDMSQVLMMNATFTSLVPNVFDPLPMSKFSHVDQDDASPTSASIDSNAILIENTMGENMPNLNNESFALKFFLSSDSRRLSLTTSFVHDYQSYESCGEMTSAQRYPSLIIDETERTMINQDGWNNAVMPTDIFSGDDNFVVSSDRP